MVSQATEIRDLIETNWDSQDNLNDRLSKVPLDNMKEIVRFFDRNQVEGNEWPKAVVVRKINDDEKEDRTVHPNFIELTDKYEITVYYRVVDVQEQSYSEALDDVESMGTEVQRILDLEFNPSTMTGPLFTANYFWFASDHLDSNQPELRRTMKLTLYQIVGIGDKVYSGFDGTLIFDDSDSSGDNLPGADFTYQVPIPDGKNFEMYLLPEPNISGGHERLRSLALVQVNDDIEFDPPNMYFRVRSAQTNNLKPGIYGVQIWKVDEGDYSRVYSGSLKLN